MYKTVYWIFVGGFHVEVESLLHGWDFVELIVGVKKTCSCSINLIKDFNNAITSTRDLKKTSNKVKFKIYETHFFKKIIIFFDLNSKITYF